MFWRVVQPVEVEEVFLAVVGFGEAESKSEHYAANLVKGLCEGMQAARLRRASGEGEVDAFPLLTCIPFGCR